MSLTELIKELRERTGAGMLDCKKALVETGNDIEKAIDWLREKGISKAAKKSGRVAAEGLVFAVVTTDNKKGVILEFNSETDFVARNDDFKNFGNMLVELVLNSNINTVEELRETKVNDKLISEQLTELIAKIGENLNIRRLTVVEANADEFVVSYIHMGGKIGVLVKAKGEATPENIEKVRGVAMHVAAMNPSFLRREEVTAEDLERERHVLTTQFIEEMKEKGKEVKEEMMNKIIEGKIGKFFQENCLNEQKYVRNDKQSVKDFVAPVTLESFVRYQVGEGIEKEETDFAAEVAAQLSGK